MPCAYRSTHNWTRTAQSQTYSIVVCLRVQLCAIWLTVISNFSFRANRESLAERSRKIGWRSVDGRGTCLILRASRKAKLGAETRKDELLFRRRLRCDQPACASNRILCNISVHAVCVEKREECQTLTISAQRFIDERALRDARVCM